MTHPPAGPSTPPPPPGPKSPALGMVPDRPRPVIPPPPPPPRPRADDVVWGRTDREHRSQVEVAR